MEEQSHWLPAEDFALHQSILTVQELQVTPSPVPLDFNWHIISDILNISSNSFKTPVQVGGAGVLKVGGYFRGGAGFSEVAGVF